jgi:hypothetical protein
MTMVSADSINVPGRWLFTLALPKPDNPEPDRLYLIGCKFRVHPSDR